MARLEPMPPEGIGKRFFEKRFTMNQEQEAILNRILTLVETMRGSMKTLAALVERFDETLRGSELSRTAQKGKA